MALNDLFPWTPRTGDPDARENFSTLGKWLGFLKSKVALNLDALDKRVTWSETRIKLDLKAKVGQYYTSQWSSFSSLLTAIGSTAATVYVNSTVTLTANTTVPANVTIRDGGGVFANGAYTLTINGPFEWGLRQAFTGTGAISFSGFNQPIKKVEWWGGLSDGVTDSSDAFLAAAATKGVIDLEEGLYICKSQLNLDSVWIMGRGMGFGSAAQTILRFESLGTSAAIITRLDSTSSYSNRLSNMRIEANSWDAVTGCRGYGLDVEAKLDLDNVMVYGFYKSNIFYHGGVSSGGPYNSVAKNVYSLLSKEWGILVGTGANNLSFIECYCAYNGSVSFGVAPSAGTVGVTRGAYDGFYIQRDTDGNPGSAYLSYLPESVRVIGGNCSYNGRYGWNFAQTQNSLLEPGYAEGNLDAAYQNVVGNSVLTSFVNIAQVAGGAASVNYSNNADNARGSTLWICGKLVGQGANNTTWLLKNMQAVLGENAGLTRQVYGLYDTGLDIFALAATGGAKVRFGAASGSVFIENDGSINRISSFYIGSGSVQVLTGAGSPEGSVTAAVGSWYFRNDSTGQVYRKSAGSGNTGWLLMYGNKDNPTFGDGATAAAFAAVNSGDGFAADLSLLNAGAELWTIRKEATAISGGATGSGGADFELIARRNDQAVIDRPMTIQRAAGGGVIFNRDMKLNTVGNGFYVKEGTNATMGVATLVAGTVTVSTTKVTASSRIYLTSQADGGTPGWCRISARSAGTSFTITSSNGADTSTIGWLIVEPA